MKLTVSKPPSTNHIYGITSRGGYAKMYLTAEGKAWFEESILLVKTQAKKQKMIKNELEVNIDFYTAYYGRQDVDGIIKPAQDLLQKAGIIENDVLIYRITSEKFKCKKGEERLEINLMGYVE